jgi:glutaredoxin
MSYYSVIHKDGTESHFVWCQKSRQFILSKMLETAVIYSNGSQECQRMSMLLKSLGGEFHEYVLEKDFTIKQFVSEFGLDAEFPQVAIGNRHIGSMKDTLQYMSDRGMFL